MKLHCEQIFHAHAAPNFVRLRVCVSVVCGGGENGEASAILCPDACLSSTVIVTRVGFEVSRSSQYTVAYTTGTRVRYGRLRIKLSVVTHATHVAETETKKRERPGPTRSQSRQALPRTFVQYEYLVGLVVFSAPASHDASNK